MKIRNRSDKTITADPSMVAYDRELGKVKAYFSPKEFKRRNKVLGQFEVYIASHCTYREITSPEKLDRLQRGPVPIMTIRSNC